jgi:hypothetical protein
MNNFEPFLREAIGSGWAFLVGIALALIVVVINKKV